jgi:hypothetical protein
VHAPCEDTSDDIKNSFYEVRHENSVAWFQCKCR